MILKNNLPAWIAEQFDDATVDFLSRESAWKLGDVIALCSGYNPLETAWRDECLTEKHLTPEAHQCIQNRIDGAIAVGDLQTNNNYLSPEAVTKWAETKFQHFPFQTYSAADGKTTSILPKKRTRQGDLSEQLAEIYKQLQSNNRPVNVSNVMEILRSSIADGSTCVFESVSDGVLFKLNNGETSKLTRDALRTRIYRWKKP